jgi:hypothetical protein
MPTPTNPNTSAAHQGRRRKALERRLAGLAAELRRYGYEVVEPAEIDMTVAQARGGHSTRGGTIASGAAVCECDKWRAADYDTPDARKLARKLHLDEVELLRTQETSR